MDQMEIAERPISKCGCGGQGHLHQRQEVVNGAIKALNQFKVICSHCSIMTLYFLHREQAIGCWNKAVDGKR